MTMIIQKHLEVYNNFAKMSRKMLWKILYHLNLNQDS